MKKYLLKIVVVIGLLTLTSFLIDLTVPYYWGRMRMAHKIEYLEDNPGVYNTFIMGSSKVHCNYDPKEFDKNLPGYLKVKTFNLGCNGSTFDENYFIAKELIPNLVDAKYLLFQITRPRALAVKEKQTIEGRYFYDWDVMKFLFSFYQRSEIQKAVGQKFLLNVFNIGELQEKIQYRNRLYKFDLGVEKLNLTHGHFNTMIEKDDWVVAGRLKRDNPRYVENLKDQLSNHKSNMSRPLIVDGALLQKVTEINNLCLAYGITCVFFSVPNEAYSLPPNLNYIYMGNGDSNNKYFNVDNHLDHVHVFPAGAKIYSEDLAQKFIQLQL